MITSIYPQITSLFYIILIAISFFTKKKKKTVENNIFKLLIIGNIMGLFIDCASFFVALKTGENILTTILGKLILVYLLLWIMTITVYIYALCASISYTDKEEKNPKWKRYSKFKITIEITEIIGVIVLLLLPLEVIVEPKGMYTIGWGVKLIYLISTILMGLWVFFLLLNKQNVKDKKFYPIYAYMILGAIASSIQYLEPRFIIIIPIETFITTLIYFTIENPDMKLVAEVSLAKDAAEKANHAKSDFLSNMSHEIRTPLNAIVGFSEALKYDDLPQESVEKVNDIIMASNNLLDIVNGILDISKIEANKLEIISKEYDIHSMLDELVSLTKARIGERNLEFKVNIDKSIPSVLYGDNTRIKQVVLNILTNAVKYTKEGYVDFRVSSVIKDNVCRLIFSVEDSGIGIKEEALPKLFSKFERLNVEKSLTIEGTGLGLAITKKLVELMDGKIIVQSVYGKGSKFTVSVDQRIITVEKPETKEVKTTESKAINANGARVLVVDDNDLNIKVASTLLKKYNFVIDSAHSGLECINKINKGEKYDIVFLDDMMPKMNGRETIKRLKADENYKIPTIALTANAITGMKEEYLSCGFDDYLSKPIEKTELERVIKTYIHKINDEITNTESGEASSIIDMDFNIPDVVPRSVQREVAKDNENALDFSDKNLLLVDDNELNLKVAEMSLKKYKFNITSVKSGSDCISKVIENKYDIIFLDDMMPDLDGCKTLDNLKTLEDFNTPVIMMTASPKDEVLKKIEEHGFNGYLGKPFKKEDLDDILNKELNK